MLGRAPAPAPAIVEPQPIPVADPAPTPPTSIPPSKGVQGKRVTLAEEREIILRHTRGESSRKIAAAMGRSYLTVQKYARQPALAATRAVLKKVEAEDARAIRQTQKERLLQRLAATTDKACDLVEGTLDEGNPTGFERAMTGIEKLDRVSGSVSGEAARGEAPTTVNVDLKVLIQQILGRPAEVVDEQ